MAYGILLLGLALFKATEFWKHHGFHGSRLVFVLVRDQAMYFVMYFFPMLAPLDFADVPLSVIFVAVFATIGDRFQVSNWVVENIIAALGSTTFLCILGSRMFFNLKEAAEHGINIGTNWSSHSHSEMQFDELVLQNEEEQCVFCRCIHRFTCIRIQ